MVAITGSAGDRTVRVGGHRIRELEDMATSASATPLGQTSMCVLSFDDDDDVFVYQVPPIMCWEVGYDPD